MPRVNTRIQHKHDLECNWNQATFVPFVGELIIYDTEVDAAGNSVVAVVNGISKKAYEHAGRTSPYTYERFKVGDGINKPKDLPFISMTPEERSKLSGISSATAATSGLTKLYTGTGSNTDGTMTQSAITNTINNLISNGSVDPTTVNITSKYYFKFND